SKDNYDAIDAEQRSKLGLMVMYMSAGLLAMVAIPNPLWGRGVFLLCAITIFSIGWLLKRSAEKSLPEKLKPQKS
ncbi:hypothetical protein AB4501_24950, partial [Vibrio sp. 10N.222.55.E8]